MNPAAILTTSMKILPRLLLRGGFALIILCVAALQAQAEQSGDFTYTATGGNAVITGYTGAGGAVAIPATLDSLPVIGIGGSAFSAQTAMTSVTIPSSVTSIADGAFRFCSGLTSVTIPASVTRIETLTFIYCTSLTSVTILGSVTSIEYGAFLGCTSLTSANFLGNAPSYLDNNAFTENSVDFKIYYSYHSDQTGFTTPTWRGYPVGNLNPFTTSPSGVTDVIITGYPKTATGALVIPATLDQKNVVGIGSQAFINCSGLTSVTIPASVTSIGDAAFYECTSLTSVAIPNSVTRIGYSAFRGCSSLTSVTVPATVTSIEGGAFTSCTSLTSVTLPASVTSIGNGVFDGCSGLTSVTVDAANPNYSSVAGVLFNKNQTTLIGYPGGKAGSYTIPASVTSIGQGVFFGCIGLTSVTIPNSVTSIGVSAFNRCSSLTSVTIPSSVTSIGVSAFYQCSSLTSVTIPAGVTSIGSSAFYGCTSLTSVTIPTSIISIGDGAFRFCSGLSRADFLGNAPTMGANAFANVATGFTVHYNLGVTGFDGAPWTGFNLVINDPPAANGQTISTLKNIAAAVVLSGSDPDGDTITYRIVTPPAKGTLTGTLPNLSYKPNADVTGSDSFTFLVNDGKLDSAPATVSIGIKAVPPLPWVSGEIGSGKLSGSAFYDAGVFTQAGAGALGTTSDKLRFSYQTLSGDGEIIANVSKLQNTGSSSRVGVMIRDSLAANSRQVFIGLSGKGAYRWVQRTAKGGKNATTDSGTGKVPKTWLRLVRKGTEISAYKSTDGKKWTLVGSTKVTMAKNCYIGLAVASGSSTGLNTSQFSKVKVKP